MKFSELYQKFSKIISKNTLYISEKYFVKFQEVFRKKISDNIAETFENCFGISWKNLGKF